MKRIISIGFLMLLLPVFVFATHNRAGQITFERVSGFTYKILVTTFTYTKSPADRQVLRVSWGDNSYSDVNRTDSITLPNYYRRNRYESLHTFPGPGIYEIVMQDPNRNFGIKNIPGSVNVIFSIKTVLTINPEIGNNNSPQLLNYPLDRAARGHIFIHNPAAYDPDGDSLSYKLTICTEQNGKPISDYTFPKTSDTLYVEPVVGDFIWYTPVDTGKYNVAINVEEWRHGAKIGNITRDMQINVYDTDNNPPVNGTLKSYCVKAGSYIEFEVTSTDEDNDSVRQSMNGGPFVVKKSPATFTRQNKGLGFTTSVFRWQTTCDHIRKQPWQVMLKSEDVNSDITLIDIDNFTIKVLAPAPENLKSIANKTDIDLKWDQSNCGNVKGYFIYRREGNYGFTPDSCENGIPAYTGYKKIATVIGKANTTFKDDNKGEGLAQGVNYCYMITSFYDDGSESFASSEVCNFLNPGFPSILQVSVSQIDHDNGQIQISWAKPRNFNVTEAPGPYVFQIFRSLTGNPSDFQLIDSIHTADLNDTTYLDTGLNTIIFPYYYSIKMFNNSIGNRFEMRPGENEIASSLYIEITPNDNTLTLDFRKTTPWINEQYVIYRQNEFGIFDSLDITFTGRYIDSGLKNGKTYTYKVKSRGNRTIDGILYNNFNLSHINSGIPVDISPPCAPVLYVESLCDSNAMNILRWTNPNKTCADDVLRYNIYYSPDLSIDLDSLTSISPPSDTIYQHRFNIGQSLSGCYAVSAIDSVGNESTLSTKICVDQCSLYELPNVFTPNDDDINDIYHSINVNHVIEKVDMKIFNRFGQLVYETTDPDINWNGKYRNTDKKLSTGVYYYTCDVYEPRLNGIEIRTLIGFIHLYADGDAETFTK